MSDSELYKWLIKINSRPSPYAHYTTIEMWNDEHISANMLKAHLDETSNSASRTKNFIQRSVNWMLKYFQISASTTIIDFGCGPGLYTNQWGQKGAHVTGIDVSRRSIEYAERKAHDQNLPITYICDNYLNYAFSERYDLITMIFCDYCVLNPHQRQQLLARWKSILQPNGKILWDVTSLKYFNSTAETRSFEYQPEGGFYCPDPHFVFHNVYCYESEHLLLEQHTVVTQDYIRTFYNWLQCFSPEMIERELENAGLVIKDWFGNVAGDALTEESTEIAIVVQNAA